MPLNSWGCYPKRRDYKAKVSQSEAFYEVSGIDLAKAAQPVSILGWDAAAV